MSNRLTYVPLEVADQFDDFIVKKYDRVLGCVRARTRDYSILSVIKLLYQIRITSLSFSDLYKKSNIRMKTSYLSYLHFCLDYGFITKKPQKPNLMMYAITEKGNTMLGFFKK